MGKIPPPVVTCIIPMDVLGKMNIHKDHLLPKMLMSDDFQIPHKFNKYKQRYYINDDPITPILMGDFHNGPKLSQVKTLETRQKKKLMLRNTPDTTYHI